MGSDTLKSFITYDTSEENLKSEQRLIPEICKRYTNAGFRISKQKKSAGLVGIAQMCCKI